MANSSQDLLFPDPRLPLSAEPLVGSRGHKAALALGLLGSGIAVLFICANWSIAVVGGAAVLVLSAMESERFLLLVICVTPLGWALPVNIPGRNLPVVMRFLVIVGFFAGRLWRGQACVGHLLRPIVSRASLLFLCAAVAPTILGKAKLTYESGRALYTLSTFIGFYFLLLAWVDSRERVHKVLRVLLLSTVATAVFAVYQQVVGGYTSFWLYLYPPDNTLQEWEGRSTSFLHHPNLLAGYLAVILPFALACYVLGPSKWKKLGKWTFALGTIALLSTQSIGGILAFVAVLALAIFYFARGHRKKLILLGVLCLLLFLSYRARDILNPVHTEGYIGSDVQTRLLLWGTAWDEFTHSPVFGVGWGNFAAPYDWDIPSLPGLLGAHSLYFQLLAETGAVGFLVFFNLILQSWRQATSRWRSSVDVLDLTMAFGVLGALLSILVHGLVDYPFDVQTGALFWILLALLVAGTTLHPTPLAARAEIDGQRG